MSRACGLTASSLIRQNLFFHAHRFKYDGCQKGQCQRYRTGVFAVLGMGSSFMHISRTSLEGAFDYIPNQCHRLPVFSVDDRDCERSLFFLLRVRA